MRLLHWLLLPLCAVLCACNVAIADKPMFQEAQRSSKLLLEDGLWFPVKADCDVDPAQPTNSWPKCADWVILSGNRAVKNSDNKPETKPEDVFIVDGQPPMIQAQVETNGSPVTYAFLVLEPQSYSPTGKIRAAKVWVVPCGIDEATEGSTAKVRPYPGFSDNCRPSSVAVLRAAAAKGPSQDSDVMQWKWVRAETR